MNFPSTRRSVNRRRHNFSDINVTPFVDVMLVLLIVFMVAAPLMTSGMEIDLPRDPASALESDVEPLSVNIDAKGRVFLQDSEIGAR